MKNLRVLRRIAPVLLTCLCALAGLTLVLAPAALAGPTVKVRVEAEGETLLAQTTVTLSAPEPVSGCTANTVAAAINLAVAGNWDHGEAAGSGGGFTETILGRTLSFENESSTWAEWVDYKWGSGICNDLLSEGDEVLMVADREPPPYAPTVLPLILSEAPATVAVGQPFTVKVLAVRTPAGTFAEPGQGTPEPAEGVTVSGGGASATSGAGGTATLTLPAAGTFALKASGHGFAASAPATVCAHEPGDGSCGSTPTTSGGVAGFSAGTTAPYKGAYALVAHLSSVANGHHYARRSSPRLLAGQVSSHSAVTSVSLSLRRSYKGRCWAYDGISERFARGRCGSAKPFKVASAGAFSYLLPSGLAPGRYVLDVTGADAAGNTIALARGTSRVVFYVG
jgi:hypothetical protein